MLFRVRFGRKLALALCFCAVMCGAQAFAASIATDTSFYAKGDAVTISGKVFMANESVQLEFVNPDGTPLSGSSPWSALANSTGRFVSLASAPYNVDVGDTLLVSATGQSSGSTATTAFVVGVGTDLDQLQNGTTSASPEWANGNINNNNSCYEEANSVPFRYFVTGTTAGTKHEFLINMEWTKGGIHAYDYITQYDLSEAGPILTAGGPCGSPNTPPGDCATPTGSYTIPSPLVLANYTGSIPSDFFTTVNPSFVLDGPGNLLFYNATIDSIGKYFFGGSPTDREFSFKVYFTTTATGSVGFFWGGHLASSSSSAWGAGMGSGAVSGAPFHMRAKDFDNGGGANQDRSIQNGGVCLPPIATISCTAMDTVCYTVGYTCSAASGAGTYVWGISGGTINSGQGTNSITYTVNGAPGGFVTITLEACNASSSCSGSFCCAYDTAYIPIKNCNTCPTTASHSDTSVFLCSSQQICIPGFSCSDPDNNLVSCVATGGTLVGNTICFTPATSGSYTLTLVSTDSYGCADTASTVVTVTINTPPVATNPPATVDTNLCTLAQICRQFSATDANGGTLTWAKLTGAGTVSSSGLWCFTPSGSGSYCVSATVTDSCGAKDTVSMCYNVTVNSSPVATNPPASVDTFICAPAQICRQFSATDANGNGLVWASLSGSGTVSSSGLWCFNATASGSYCVTATVTDPCGAKDTVSMCYNVTINAAPVVTVGNDTSVFQCSAAQICIPYTVTDANGNITTEVLLSGLGTIDTVGNTVCYTPVVSGSNTIIIKATDACGATDQDTIVITVSLNAPPVISFGNDSSAALCTAGQQCVPYTTSDPNNNIVTEILLSGTGTIDTVNNQVCFTPPSTGTYTFVVKVTDACGAYDIDTINLTYSVNVPPVATNPPASIDTFICAPAQICRQFSATDANGNGLVWAALSGSGTVSSSGLWCFNATATGSYCVTATVTDPCGAKDTISMCYNVTINSTPVATNPPATVDTFICAPAQICRQFSAADPNGNGLVWAILTGSGTVSSSGLWCFDATASGSYCVTATVSDPCGAKDTVSICYNVTINSTPVATNPPASVDTFMCAPAQICRQFSATDANGNGLVWAILTGSGTVSSTGLWCFNATASGSYCVSATVADPCGAKDTVTMCYNVTINSAPVATNPPTPVDTFICATGAQICRQFSATDADGQALTWALLSGSGTVSPTGLWCFTANATGQFCVTATVADPCGAKDTVTLCYNVTVNTPPVVTNPPASVDTFLCLGNVQICRQFSATDANGNGLVWAILSGSGTVSPTGLWCFTANTSGQFCVSATVTDPCGAKDTVSICYIVTINTPPVAVDPPASIDTALCAAGQICRQFSASDANGNGLVWTIISGSGTVSPTGLWCFTANATGQFCVTAAVADPCGTKDTVTMCYNVTVNVPPVVQFGPDRSITLCSPAQQCETYTVSDGNGLADIVSETVVSAPAGTIFDTVLNRVCYTPSVTGVYTFVVKVTDKCGATDQDTVVLNVTVNVPPVVQISVESISTLLCLGADSTICVSYMVSDAEGGVLTEYLESGTATIDTAANTICVAPDANGSYIVVVAVKDNCNTLGRDTATIIVNRELCCPSITIEKKHNVLQGGQSCVRITMQDAPFVMGGFDFLIAYDASAMAPLGVTEGQLYADCKWEYFTYRFGVSGNCGSGCPSGLIKITGVAEIDNGAWHPTCFGPSNVDTTHLATICFLVSNDRTLECQFAPIRFFWTDCTDNTISSKWGDSLFISDEIYDYDNLNPINDGTVGFPTFFGAQNSCIVVGQPGKPPASRCLDFYNGGIDIICADSIDARGDINLNGLANEVADAVMFSNFFIQGLSAFAGHVAGSTAASDVNADGISLSVADLVYLIRVIVGDARPIPKLGDGHVNVLNDQGTISITDADLGAVYMVLKGSVVPTLVADARMSFGFDGVNTRVLLHAPFDISAFGRPISGFSGGILQVNAEIVSIEMADVFGNAIKATLPTEYQLSQNYPNPFNPSTQISYDLPVASSVTIMVYDVLGQVVTTLVVAEQAAGRHVVTWNGRDDAGTPVASGVYFYRLDAGSFTSTRKMILLK